MWAALALLIAVSWVHRKLSVLRSYTRIWACSTLDNPPLITGMLH